MTKAYIQRKIEEKAKPLNNTSCLITYCCKAFGQYFTDAEICTIINNTQKGKTRKFRSPFILGN